MASPQFNKVTRHNDIIDILRFIAALFVVLFHLNQSRPGSDNWYSKLVSFGWLGVPIFFVISGYCIVFSAYNSTNIKDFISRRFFRIFPPYWFSIIIVCIAAMFQYLYTGINSVHNLPHSLINLVHLLTLTTAPLTNVPTINSVYWSLTCELFFYGIVCLGLCFGKKRIVYVLMATSLIAAILSLQHTGIFFFFDQWPAFGIGLSIYYLIKSNDAISYLFFFFIFAINIYALLQKFSVHPQYIVVTFVTTALIFIGNLITIRKNLFSTLGEHSYSVYLIHVPVGVFILGMFEPYHMVNTPWYNIICDLIVYCVIGLLAWPMYLWVEKPSIQIGKLLGRKQIGVNVDKQNGK